VTAQVSETTVPFFKTGKELRVRLNRGGMKRRT
jgi:nucleoid DNA-binding protein